MSLQIWLPLNGDLRNNGLSDYTLSAARGTISYDNSGKIGKCFQATGTNAIKIANIIPDFYKYNSYSFSAWACITAQNTSHAGSAIISAGNWNSQLLNLAVSNFETDHYTRLLVSGSNWTVYYTHNFYLNTWYHIVITCDGVKTRAYVDSTLIGDTLPGFLPTAIQGDDIYIGGATYTSIMQFYGKINDVRIYDHALSPKEVKLLSQGLVCHYQLNQPFSINNLLRNTTYVAYNNYSGSGSTASLVATGGKFEGCDIYRLTYTPNDTSIANVQGQLANHGIYGFRRTFSANTKYCFWILWRSISHPDTVVGGTASNIGGWTEIPSSKFNNGWNVVGQYRDGSVTSDKTDYIFTSFKTPSAVSGEPIVLEFCCPHLVEGYDYILPENEYQLNNDLTVYDCSGNGYNSTLNISTSVSSDTPRNSLCTSFDVKDTPKTTLVDTSFLSVLDNCTITWWEKPKGSGDMLLFSSPQNTSTFIAAGSTTKHFYDCNAGSTSILYVDTEPSVSVFSSGKLYHQVFHIPDEWHHYALVGANLSSWTQFQINAYTGFPTYSYLSDIRIYATPLSVEDIKTLYEAPVSVTNTGTMMTQGEFVEAIT